LLFSGRFAVCLFFVLSGFVLSLRYLGVVAAGNPDLGASITKRTFRLAGLLLTTATFGYVLMCADLFFNNEVAVVTGSQPVV
jgi:peptidoglycan/LPS O-acetylase OafA/YrhL